MSKNNLDYTFKTESQENIKIIEDKLVDIESSKNIRASIQEIYRCAHSLKGATSMMEFDSLKEITHQMENVLQATLENNILPTTETVDILLETCDFLNDEIDNYPKISNNKPYKALTEKLKKCSAGLKQKNSDSKKIEQSQHADQESQTKKVNNFLMFKSGNKTFTVPMYYIKEVLTNKIIKPIEYTENYVLGVINFHSTVVPVIDFNFRFGLFEKTDEADHRIVVFKHLGTLLGVKIDKLVKMFSPVSLDFERDKDSNLRTFCDGFYTVNNEKIFLLNVPTLFYYKKREP